MVDEPLYSYKHVWLSSYGRSILREENVSNMPTFIFLQDVSVPGLLLSQNLVSHPGLGLTNISV